MIGYGLNIIFVKSMLTGIFLFVLYIAFFGYWAGKVFFDGEEFETLLGIYSALCFIIVGESLFLILNLFVFPLIIIPYIFFPLFLFVWTTFGKTRVCTRVKRAEGQKQFVLKTHAVELMLSISFFSSSAFCVYALVSSRTSAMIFSVLEVVPLYFWISILVSLTILMIASYLSYLSHLNGRCLMPMLFTFAFTIFGAYLLVFEYGFDADPYGWITSIKLVFTKGFRSEIIVFSKRGLEAIVGSVAVLSGPQFDFTTAKIFFDSLNPILASIYIPLFTYQFLRRLNVKGICSLCLLGTLGFMIFPTFFNFAVTNSNYIGGLFLFGTLFMTLRYFDDQKSNGCLLIPIVMSFLATAVIHPVPFVYSIMAVILAFITIRSSTLRKNLVIKIRNTRTSINASALLLVTATFMVSAMPLVALSIGPSIQSITGASVAPIAILGPPSLDKLLKFFTPAWLQPALTASNIIGEGYNWVRLFIFIIGIYWLSYKQSFSKKLRVWISSILCSYFIAWFTIPIFLQQLAHDPYRFALMLDLALLPLAGFLIHDLFQTIFSHISRRRIKKISFLGLAIFLSGLMVMPVSVMYLLPLFPQRWPYERPLPGRPTARAVTAEEVNALNYIANTTTENYAVVTSDSFLVKIAQALLTFRAFNGTNNIFVDSNLIRNVITNNDLKAMQRVGVMTNSSLVFLFFNDWFLTRSGISKTKLDNLRFVLSFIGGNYKSFGEQYEIFLVGINISNIRYVEDVIDLSMKGHNGIVSDSTVLVPSIKGSALYFGGVDSYVKVNDSELLSHAKLSLEAWVYLATNHTYVNPIVSKYYGGAYPSQNQYILAMYPTLNQVYLYLSDGHRLFYVNANTCPTFQWLHIVATYDGQHMRIYFNGSLATEREWIGSVAASSTPLFIGSKSPEVEPQYFNGLIDEVRVYNRALNSTEVLYSYQNLIPMSTDGLVLWFSFDA